MTSTANSESRRKHVKDGDPLKDKSNDDLYRVLGVARDATEADIKRAYRKLALKHHPDKVRSTTNDNQTDSKISPSDGMHSGSNSTDMFQKISFAYSVLSDESKRKYYDQTGDTEEVLSSMKHIQCVLLLIHTYSHT